MSLRTANCLAALVLALASAGTALASDVSGKWRIETVSGAAGLDVSRTEMAFDGSGAAAMTVGCNRLRSHATIANGEISFGPVASTRMACPPPLPEIESRFVAVLADVRKFTSEAGRLRLLDAQGNVLIQLQRLQ
jgi:heat shock protein HslJ